VSSRKTQTAPDRIPSAALTRNQRLELYYYARLTRDIEERVNILHKQGKVTGAVYRSLGQEGESVATAYALRRDDALSPLTRNLGALLTMGVRPLVMFLQYMAKGTSAARGRDLSNHFANIPLGDMVAVMTGVALAAKMQKRPMVAMVYVGDGATSTGVFHEAMNFAAVKRVPLVVIAEDNKFAYSTPVHQQMAIAHIDQRAEAYGIRHQMVDGNDMLAVYDAARQAVDAARRGDGPVLLGIDTMRMKGHAAHDDMRYVPADLVDTWTKRDPIALYRARLKRDGIAKDVELDEIDRMTKAYAEEESQLATAAPEPDPSTAARGLFAGDPFVPTSVEIVRSPFAETTAVR
jgi:TPP-dependent pyruvate/acetoin dehydrogenase alpha subunit